MVSSPHYYITTLSLDSFCHGEGEWNTCSKHRGEVGENPVAWSSLLVNWWSSWWSSPIDVRSVLRLIFWGIWEFSSFSVPFVLRLFFPYWIVFVPYKRSIDCICVGLVLGSLFHFIGLCCCFVSWGQFFLRQTYKIIEL